MLKQRTSSASHLRIESALRHNIRNLRAKVRSILPQELCPRQARRNQSTHFHYSSNYQKQVTNKHELEIAKKMNKQFDKLTVQQLQEINANKHYFFGNDQAIAYYEQYINQYHPAMKSKEFSIPQPADLNDHIVLSFIPYNLIVRKQQRSRQSSSSCKNMLTQKRISTSSMTHHRKQSLINQDIKYDHQAVPEKVQQCLSKKQEIDEQKRVRRELGFLNWQRQQQIATANREQIVKQKIEAARSAHSPGRYQRSKQRNAKKMIQQYQIACLTSKLRKVCLKRKQNGHSSHLRQ